MIFRIRPAQPASAALSRNTSQWQGGAARGPDPGRCSLYRQSFFHQQHLEFSLSQRRPDLSVRTAALAFTNHASCFAFSISRPLYHIRPCFVNCHIYISPNIVWHRVISIGPGRSYSGAPRNFGVRGRLRALARRDNSLGEPQPNARILALRGCLLARLMNHLRRQLVQFASRFRKRKR